MDISVNIVQFEGLKESIAPSEHLLLPCAPYPDTPSFDFFIFVSSLQTNKVQNGMNFGRFLWFQSRSKTRPIGTSFAARPILQIHSIVESTDVDIGCEAFSTDLFRPIVGSLSTHKYVLSVFV